MSTAARLVLLRRNAERSGPARVPADEVRRYAAIATRHTDRAQLAGEGVDLVIDVPGETEGFSSLQAVELFHFVR